MRAGVSNMNKMKIDIDFTSDTNFEFLMPRTA